MYCVKLGDQVIYAGTDPAKAAKAAEKVGRALNGVRLSPNLKLENTDKPGHLPTYRPPYDHSQDFNK